MNWICACCSSLKAERPAFEYQHLFTCKALCGVFSRVCGSCWKSLSTQEAGLKIDQVGSRLPPRVLEVLEGDHQRHHRTTTTTATKKAPP